MSSPTETWFHGDGAPHGPPSGSTDAVRAEECAQTTPRPDAPVPIATLGRMLRGIGATVLLAAASTFLLQHWETGNDLARYAGLLGLTVLLTAAGFFTGIRLGETKGARTFLALAAAVVPAHFCILGGLLYSQLAAGGLQPVPEYATWVAPSATAAIATTALALLLLVPTSFVSLLTLARSRARTLTAAFVGANALLLLPSRDPQIVSLLLGAAGIGLAALELRVLQRDLALRTFEGVLVRLLLVAGPVLMALRSILHYDLSAGFGFVVSAALAGLVFALSRAGRLQEPARDLLEIGAAVPAGAACLFGAIALESAGLPDALVLPAAALPFAGILTALSVATRGRAAIWRSAAAWVALSGTALNLALFENALAAFVCLGVSIAVLSIGVVERRRGLALAGGTGAIFALAHHVQAAIALYAWSSWGSLAALGVLVILGASLLERHHGSIQGRLEALRARFTADEP